MATATKQEVVTTQVVPDGVLLRLTDEEAWAIRDVLVWVGGGSRTTRRRHIDAVKTALDGAGYKHRQNTGTTGSIYFKEA